MNDGFDIERELFFAMEEETSGLGAPELDLDRMRRSKNRRTAVLTGSAGAVVAVGVGVAFALGSGGGKGSGNVVSAGSPLAVSTAAKPTAAPPSSPAASSAIAWPGGVVPSNCATSKPSPGDLASAPFALAHTAPSIVIGVPPTRPGERQSIVSLAPPVSGGATIPPPTIITEPSDARGVVVILCYSDGAVQQVIPVLPKNVKPVDEPLPSSGK